LNALFSFLIMAESEVAAGTDSANGTDANEELPQGLASLITQVEEGDPPTPPRTSKGSGSLNMKPLQKTLAQIGKRKGAALLGPQPVKKTGFKTLVLDLDETLVHSSFKNPSNGKRDFTVPVPIDNVVHTVYVNKRPYVDKFLEEVTKDYEIVLFTASLPKYADPLLDMLDSGETIDFRLFREHCVQTRNMCYVKDLSKLGRDVKDCIIIDNSAQSYDFHHKNAIPIPSWFSDKNDEELLNLLPVLRKLKDVESIPDTLDANKGYNWLLQNYKSFKTKKAA